MTTSTIAKRMVAKAFPAAAAEAKLRTVLLEAAKSAATLRGLPFPTALPAQQTAAIPLDSLQVVALLCEIEPIVGFELKESLVKTGGYDSVNAATDHLMPRLEAAWKKNDNKGTTK